MHAQTWLVGGKNATRFSSDHSICNQPRWNTKMQILQSLPARPQENHTCPQDRYPTSYDTWITIGRQSGYTGSTQ